MGLAGSYASAGEVRSLDPPVYLPDGQEFKTWEVPVIFTRTYYVNESHAQASDDNPGTESLPFLTINRAAQVLQPGERVVIHAGTYRERVRPARGGSGADQMISYEAAPQAKVVIKGSRALRSKWFPSRRNNGSGLDNVWMTTLPGELFPEQNPFAQVNLTDGQIDACMPWAVSTKGKVPNALRRGLIFQGGRRLKQVAAYEQLAGAEGTYWVEADGRSVHVHPLQSVDPNQAAFEATTQGFIFAPEEFGLGYIRVKGLTVEHSANCFPRPQQGAISTQRGHHWIIEENAVRECNSIGIDIGDQFDVTGPKLAEGGRHIVRGNTITDCGIGGIEGLGIEQTLIETNTIRRCGWQRIWRIYEVAGIKVHCTVSCLVRRNLVTDTIDAPGIWLDYANRNSRVTGNVVINTECSNGGIFMEASQAPNMVDTNFVWGTQGNGIYQHDCDELVIAHNFVGQSSEDALRMQICQGREVLGRLSTARRNRILNNLFVAGDSMLFISDPDNVSDHNVFALGRKPFDLAEWQNSHGWDKNSLVADVQAAFDPDTLELTWSTRGEVPECPPVDGITHDFFGRPRAAGPVLPGPFGSVPREPMRIKLNVR
ncbi:MAG: hypothetical protein A2V98_15575 [Planctomycetes bacterium RBG_16_64_12]|nr:MAG: hypothetical protein A2V98_15575 [Planctomycetes bacterium RBG_16_64_12]